MAVDNRLRDWRFLVYVDSAPPDWKEILSEEYGWCFAVSPLHDQDVYTQERELDLDGAKIGEHKKPHHHCVVEFPGKKSFSYVRDVLASINQPMPKACDHKRGAIRYFWHLDNPEKFQYDKDIIDCFNGFDIANALKPSGSELDLYITQMENFIVNARIFEFASFVEAVKETENEDWLYVLRHCSFGYFKGYLQSRYLRLKDHQKDLREKGLPVEPDLYE